MNAKLKSNAKSLSLVYIPLAFSIVYSLSSSVSGTEFLVTQLADINPGPASSIQPPLMGSPYEYSCEFAEIGGKLYFRAWGVSGTEPYMTDGNTVSLIADVNPEPNDPNPFIAGGSWPSEFTGYDGNVFFSAIGPNGRELYKSDGIAITEFDISPGPEDSSPQKFTECADELFFVAHGPNGRELYKTDGNTVSLVADINPGPGDSIVLSPFTPWDMAQYADGVFFGADGSKGMELYRADGNSVIDFDINTGIDGSYPDHFTEYNGELFFSATGPNGRELYKTDGTTISLVADINPGPDSSGPGAFTVFSGELFFSAEGPDGKELYKTDGTTVTLVPDQAKACGLRLI